MIPAPHRPWAVPTGGEVIDAGEFAIDGLGKGEGVESGPEAQQRLDLRWVPRAGRHETVERGLGTIVDTFEARAHASLAEELHRWLEEVHHQPELVAVQIVDRGDGLGRIIAVPAQELADVSPVFLLDVGVVVLLVRPAAGELDGVDLAIVPQVMIDELAAIIGVHAAQGEGQRTPELLKGGTHEALALAEDGVGLDPAGVDIGEVEGLGELAGSGVAGVETRSISVKPGVVTFQCSVRTGMWCLSKVPGLVRP